MPDPAMPVPAPQPTPTPVPGTAPGTWLRFNDGTAPVDVTGMPDQQVQALVQQLRGSNPASRANILATLRQPAPPPAPAGPPPTDIERVLSSAWQAFNPLEGVKNIAHFVGHPIEAFKNIQKIQAEVGKQGLKDIQEGRNALGQARIAFSRIPVAGPILNQVVTDWTTGRKPEAIGTVLGLGASFALPSVAGKVVGKVAKGVERGAGAIGAGMYEGGLPAEQGMTTAGRLAATEQGLRGGAVAKGVTQSEAGLARLTAATEDLKTAIQAQADATAGSISPNAALQKFNAYRKSLEVNNAPADVLAAVDNAKETFLNQFRTKPGSAVRNLTPGEATKEVLGKGVPPPPVQFAEATARARAAMADGLAEKITQDLPQLGEQLGPLKAQQDLARLIQKEVLAAPKGKGVSAADVAMTVMDPTWLTKVVLTNKQVKSWLAIQLARGLTGEGKMAAASARVAAYTAALGNVAGPAPEGQ